MLSLILLNNSHLVKNDHFGSLFYFQKTKEENAIHRKTRYNIFRKNVRANNRHVSTLLIECNQTFETSKGTYLYSCHHLFAKYIICYSNYMLSNYGECGIRTLAPLPANGFQGVGTQCNISHVVITYHKLPQRKNAAKSSICEAFETKNRVFAVLFHSKN